VCAAVWAVPQTDGAFEVAEGPAQAGSACEHRTTSAVEGHFDMVGITDGATTFAQYPHVPEVRARDPVVCSPCPSPVPAWAWAASFAPGHGASSNLFRGTLPPYPLSSHLLFGLPGTVPQMDGAFEVAEGPAQAGSACEHCTTSAVEGHPDMVGISGGATESACNPHAAQVRV
jgi:hypothetical protein